MNEAFLKQFKTKNFNAFPCDEESCGYGFTHKYKPKPLKIRRVQALFQFLNEAVKQTEQYKALVRLDIKNRVHRDIMEQMTGQYQDAYTIATSDVNMFNFAFDIPSYHLNAFEPRERNLTLVKLMERVLEFLILKTHEAAAASIASASSTPSFSGAVPKKRSRKTPGDVPVIPVDSSFLWSNMRDRLEAYMTMLKETVAVHRSPERPYYRWRDSTFVYGSKHADALVHMLRKLIVFLPRAFWSTFWQWALVKALASRDDAKVVRFLYYRLFRSMDIVERSALDIAFHAFIETQTIVVLHEHPLSPMFIHIMEKVFTEEQRHQAMSLMTETPSVDHKEPRKRRWRLDDEHHAASMHALCSRFQML